MNEDRIVGTARNVGGRVQEGFGRATGDTKSQAEGLINQAAGAAQDIYGQAKDTASDAAQVMRQGAMDAQDHVRRIIEQRPYTTAAGLRTLPGDLIMDIASPALTKTLSDEALPSAVSWPAIAAGSVAAAALTLTLLAFGAGMGFSAVSPWSDSGISASTFKVGTGIYLIVTAMIASSVGGYLAGRLRTKWVGVHTHEVYFRDTAHGFVAWAFATVLSAAALGAATTHIVGGAAQGLGAGAGQSASIAGGPADLFVDKLLRPVPGATPAPAPSPGPNVNDQGLRRELARLVGATFRDGRDLVPADRTYLVQLVPARTGLSQADAEKRVSDVAAEAKAAADAARKAAAQLSLWLTASLLVGAFAASLAATEGGGLRDGTWTYERASIR